MKKILVLIGIFISILFLNFSSVDAFSIHDIFKPSSDGKIPYCSNGDCGLKEGIKKVKGEVKDIYYDDNKGASGYIQGIIAYLLTFLLFIGVIIIIYAGFTILTANGDEEKVSKAKKIILYVIIGMVVIFLAGPITNFILDMFESAKK